MRPLFVRLSRVSACAALAVVVVPTFSVPNVAAAAAIPIRVTTTNDNVLDGSRCTLRGAILAANTDTAVGGCRAGHGTDVVLVPAGRYLLDRGGQDENGGLTGDLDVWTNMTIRGASAPATIIDGVGLDRVFQVLAGPRVVIDHLVITNGTTAPHIGRTVANSGGGIANYANLVLTASLVTGNHTGDTGDGEAGGQGGGIFNSGMITVRDSWITDNTADAGAGLYSSGSAYVVRSHVEDNRAKGMASHPPVVPERLSDDWSPASGDAGGITSSGYLSVSTSVVAGNIGDNEWGHGGISMGRGVISDSTIEGNSGSVCGTGGITMVYAQLIRSTVSGNSNGNCGPGAGGVYAVNSEIINSTISGNVTGGMAVGGIVAENSTIVSSTITLNRGGLSDRGYYTVGGLQADQTTLRNTILAGNLGGSGYPNPTPQPDCEGAVLSGGHNLIGSTAGCSFKALSSDLIGVNPKLGPLADYGGPTLTHKLLPGSPAIDAWYDGSVGNRATCPALDQRGVHRPQDGNGDRVAKCDIGAFERTN